MNDAAEEEARQVADRYWDRLLETDPIIGTETGDERFDDRLPDLSPEGQARTLEVHREGLAAVEATDRDRLGMVTRTTLDVMEAVARRGVEDIELGMDRLRATSHLWGPGQLLAVLASLQRADTPERLDRYVARLGALPGYLDQIEAIGQEGIDTGVTSPGLVVDRAIAQVERLLALPPEESPALRPVPTDDPAAVDRVVGVIRDVVVPAYRTYLEFLRRYRPSATETLGLSALPGGDALYQAQIRAWTTLAMPAGEIHDIGRKQLELIGGERLEIARSLGYDDPDEAIRAYSDSGKNTASSRQDLIERAERQVELSWEAAPRWFGRLPSTNCRVRPVEEFREADMPFAFYNPPTPDGGRPGIYYVNTSDVDKRPLHHLASTTYHEANPGHHFQIALEMEFDERPALRRFGGIFAGSAFIEGWGLYSERLADEMGLYADEYERMGMLEAQGWRAARLVVDTGIHAFGWSRERSVETLVEAGVPRLDAEIETDRYIAIPGQALAYMIGQLEIQRARAAAAEGDGEGFSLPDFHDRLLSLGAIPLLSLRRELGTAGGR